MPPIIHLQAHDSSQWPDAMECCLRCRRCWDQHHSVLTEPKNKKNALHIFQQKTNLLMKNSITNPEKIAK